MLIWAANESYEPVDFREIAPAASFENMYKGDMEAFLVGDLGR